MLGEGPSGTSGGGNGSYAHGQGGVFGGGGRGTFGANTGPNGAVRVIWPGDTRQFPNTDTADV
jgi:hypothetical protein